MASACSSNASMQKSSTTTTTLNTNISGTRCYLQKKKPMNPLAMSIRPPKSDMVRERVRSAKMIKIRSLQSQLNDANFHLMELAQENRALKTTQRRQDKALNTYEGVNADLPRFIKSHEEENRTLIEKNRTMKKHMRELTDLLKARDDELLNVKDQLKHLGVLAADKSLMEREQLRDSLNEAKELIKNYESEISLLNRKLLLEAKNCRQKVNAEVIKHKKCQHELAQAISEIDRQNETKGRLLRRRYESPSTVRNNKSTSNLSETPSKEVLSLDEVKLEPIKKKSADSRTSLTSPVEKIKARLSAPETRPTKVEDINEILDKLNMEEEFLKKSLQGGFRGKLKPTKLDTLVSRNGLRSKNNENKETVKLALPPHPLPPPIKPTPTFAKDKEKLFEDAFVDRVIEDEDFEENAKYWKNRQNLPDAPEAKHYTDQDKAIDESSFSDTEEMVQQHLKSLHESELEFQKVQEEIKEIEMIEDQIGKKTEEGLLLNDDDYDLVNKIWSEEYSFRKAQESLDAKGDASMLPSTPNSNPKLHKEKERDKDPVVALQDKQKLLAALREIDNGNEIKIENNPESDSRKSRLIKELFG